MADKDITVWTDDDVTRTGLDRIMSRYLVTEEDLEVPGGMPELFRRAEFEKGEDQRKARWTIDVITHVILNLMRADSGLDFTDVKDPRKWPIDDLTATIVHTRKKRKRIAGDGHGVQSGDRFIAVDVIDREIGWGNDHVANRNPNNSDGINPTTEPRPGWWYRMVHSEENRETLLRLVEFWDPLKVGVETNEGFKPNDRRREQLLNDPRRKRALEIIDKSKGVFGDPDHAPAPINAPLPDETIAGIREDLERGKMTQAAIAEKWEVSTTTVYKVKRGDYNEKVPV